MAEKVAAPMGSIDKLTVISSDGASTLPRQVTDNVMQTMQLLKDTTGFDLTAVIDRLGKKDVVAGETD
jgi:flotillin